MKKSLLLGIAGMAAVAGTPNVRAACIPTQDCAELGYKYTSSECAGDRIACPFDTSKFFCFEPQICNYSYTAASCSSQCKSVGSTSCVKDGTTYYSSCGSSLCSSEQTCNNGTCVSPVARSGACCGHASECKMSGKSNPYDSNCLGHWGKSCYNYCRENWGYPDCEEMWTSCRTVGGTPVFNNCALNGYNSYNFYSNWSCKL